jgi:hypothetical protein
MFPNAHYVVLHIGEGRTELQDVSLTAIGDTRRFDLTEDIWIERLGWTTWPTCSLRPAMPTSSTVLCVRRR